MRVTIFDDDGNELAQGSVRGLKLDSRNASVDITAKIVTSWHPLPEGGARSVNASIAALMEFLSATGKTVVSYSSGSLTGPDINLGQIAGSGMAGIIKTFDRRH